MSHTLIISAHPSSTGFTKAISMEYIRGLVEINQSFEIIDLYEDEWKQDFLTFENIKELPHDPVKTEIQKKITEASEIVFIHPVWWGNMPAILKNFIDQNFSAGFAYKYLKGGRVQKLLLVKTARVILTCDVPLWQYLLIGLPIMTSWFFPILDFCGLDVKSFTVFDKMRKRQPEQLHKWLQKIYLLAKNQNRPASIILFTFKSMSKIKDLLKI